MELTKEDYCHLFLKEIQDTKQSENYNYAHSENDIMYFEYRDNYVGISVDELSKFILLYNRKNILKTIKND